MKKILILMVLSMFIVGMVVAQTDPPPKPGEAVTTTTIAPAAPAPAVPAVPAAPASSAKPASPTKVSKGVSVSFGFLPVNEDGVLTVLPEKIEVFIRYYPDGKFDGEWAVVVDGALFSSSREFSVLLPDPNGLYSIGAKAGKLKWLPECKFALYSGDNVSPVDGDGVGFMKDSEGHLQLYFRVVKKFATWVVK